MGLLDLSENQHNFVERVRRTFNRNSVVVTFTKFAFDRPDEAVSYSEKSEDHCEIEYLNCPRRVSNPSINAKSNQPLQAMTK